MPLPHLTQARAPLTCEIDAVNEYGEPLQIAIPAERALTVYVDKRELVTLMTLGAHPELLVLGYLRNQRLVRDAAEIESITVDWDVGAAAVKTRHGIADIDEKTARKVVTTGCGQGSVFGGLMDEVDQIELPADACITQAQLYGLVNTIRLKETTYKSAGSVHACALFSLAAAEPEMLLFVEDVGRHNAIDTIAGWMAMNLLAPTLPTACGSLPPEGAAAPADWQSQIRGPGWSGSEVPTLSRQPSGLVFYTTGRLTSEMVIKSAQMGVPIVVSRSGITQMGHQVAQAVGLCAIGRATNRRFVCYAQPGRLKLQPDLAGPRLRAPETA
ncbi:MAG: formate dehydrogenase accessory sulfurtransferase FdhD [Polaromonas sp.]|uniref:formate dehydrogenase accessory sulfurtransferase FdhD n=1 Tax=Polaromonas sp. TaxID=1869339 RepID=UPI0024896537|nr:formate dehydrogenase accessory sulfurtransferase FdhD [Polaromonas sp.]MDI1237131.1 formate dehydrogenase accessory sulfurtransferase FdhD [Polaromonas sp.]MDI1338233.1 formate dehydrogenase accessory sulfurtransferase FdhD [Polaromonas sp.]